MAQTFLAAAASSWAVLMGISPVLQIRRMLQARSSAEVSVGYFMVLFVGFLLWIAYGVAAGLPALVIPNTVALIVDAAVITVALRLRRRATVPGSPVMSPAPDAAADRAEQHENEADHQDDDPDRPENGDLRDEADDKQDDAEDDHCRTPVQRW
jgi:uncharacterized protein with PQ loop repeat